MLRALLLIYVYAVFGCHKLRPCLIYVVLILTPNQSYLHQAPSRFLLNAEMEKKNKYAEAFAVRRAQFTPLCFSVDVLAESEANCFLKRTACRLSLNLNLNLNTGQAAQLKCPGAWPKNYNNNNYNWIN